ncbi:MAG: LamG-like jellyroll fold domain-containing protein, partial [Acidimicrobiales bacterium]
MPVGSYDQSVYADQPGAWWKLSDAVGSATAQDFSGWGNNGSATNVTFGQTSPITVMPLDTGASFNGSSSKLTTSYNPSGSQPSVEALVNVASAVTGVILANSSTSRTGGVILGLSSGKPYITFGNGTAQATVTASAAISTGSYHQVAGTWNATTVTLYVDGAAAGTVSLSGTLHAGQTNLAIGVNPDGNTGWFAGTIAEIAYCPSVLSPQDIANRASLMTGGYAAPVLSVQAAFGQNPFSASTPMGFTWTPLPNVRSYSETTGRQHELQRFEAGTAQILLDGTDGRYLPWNTSGPYYGSLTIGTPVQVSASYQGVTYPVFYGYAQSWTPQWVGTGYSNTMLALYDGLQFLSLYEMVNGSLYPNLVKSEGVAAFWRFSDSYPANPPSAYIAELIGNYTAQVMGLTIGSQSFGVAGPIVYDPATALTMPSGSSIRFPVAASSAVGSGAGTIEFWLDNLTGATTVQFSPYSAGAPSGETYLDIGIFGTGKNGQVSLLYNLGEVNSSISVNDGNPHHIVFTWTGWDTGTVSLYVDGVLQGSASSTAYCSPFNVLVGSTQLIFNVAGNSVTVANMAWYPSALNSTQVAANFATGFLLQTVQSTGARIQAMLETLVGVPAAYCSLANGITTSCQGETSSVVGTKALDYIDNLVQTEQSQFFQSPAGVFTFQDRHWAMDSGLSVISQLFCSNDPAHPGCQYEFGMPDMPLDDLDFFNVFTVTRINGIQQSCLNATAVASGLLRQQDITGLYYLTDAESLQCAEWLALKYGNPLQRVQALDLELYNADGSNTPGSGSYIAQILALLFMSRVTVRRVGYAAGDTFQQDSLVEGINMSI